MIKANFQEKYEEVLPKEKKEKKTAPKKSNSYSALQKEISKKSGFAVKIQEDKIIIAFKDENELQQIINKLC